MNTTEPLPLSASVMAPSGFATVSRSELDIQRLVRQCAYVSNPPWRGTERRESIRAPFPHVIQLIPIDRKQLTPSDTPLLGIGRNIAPRGLDFYHTQPLPSRRVIVVLEGQHPEPKYLVLDVNWSRFLKQGCYLSGGRFIEIVTPPANPSASAEPLVAW
jgi:hypothetical protein